MVSSRNAFVDLTNRAIKKVLFDTYVLQPEMYPEIFNVMSVDSGKNYIESEVSTLGVIPVKAENADIVYQDPAQLYDQTYTFRTYAGGWKASEEMVEDDLFGIMGKKMAAQLGKSLKYTIEQDAANVYNRATNDTYAGGDAVGLCSAAHPIEGGTEQNELSTAADLSVTSLRQAIQDMEETVDYKGKLGALKPTNLLAPPEEYWNAMELLKSAQDPASANNKINPLKNYLELMVNPYLTDADACFLLDKTAADGHLATQFIWRVKPDIQLPSMNDFDSGELKYKVRARWATGWTAWRGIYLIQGV